jgi:outer membrane protein TolC
MLKRIFLVLFFSELTLIAYNQTRNLEFYLNQGLLNSPLLNDYKNQVSAGQSDSLLIAAARKPMVEARSQLLYSPAYRHFGYDEIVTDQGNYTAVVAVTQPVFNKKEFNNKYNAVDIQKQSIKNSSKITVTELNKTITDQYITSYSGLTDLAFNKSFLSLLQKENEIVKQFVKNGIARQTDYLSLSIEIQSQEILISQLKNQYRKDLMLLNQLCGLRDSAWYDLDDPALDIKGSPDIKKSPSYIQYKIDSIKLENEKTAIDIRYKPKVNWFADAGFLTSNPWNFYQHFGYSAGLSLSVPLYDGKQRSIEKQKIEFSENTRQVYKSAYYNQYFQQVQQLELELKALNDMSTQVQNQLNTSEQLVNTLKEQLEAGTVQMTEYISAIKNFRTSSRNINLIRVQKLQVINELNFLLTQ